MNSKYRDYMEDAINFGESKDRVKVTVSSFFFHSDFYLEPQEAYAMFKALAQHHAPITAKESTVKVSDLIKSARFLSGGTERDGTRVNPEYDRAFVELLSYFIGLGDLLEDDYDLVEQIILPSN